MAMAVVRSTLPGRPKSTTPRTGTQVGSEGHLGDTFLVISRNISKLPIPSLIGSKPYQIASVWWYQMLSVYYFGWGPDLFPVSADVME